MTGTTFGSVLGICAALLGSSVGWAQERGRTDGPEGSEYGKGGYEKHGGGSFSVQADLGAAIQDGATGVPLYGGATASFWASDWFLLDLSGGYLGPNGKVNVLAGPRFRTATWPISGTLGLKAGAIFTRSGLRFGLSPQAGADLLFHDRFLLGLNYAPDIAIGGDGVAHRIFMSIGYRF